MNRTKLDPGARKILIVVTENEEYILPIEPGGRDLINQPHLKVISDSNFYEKDYHLIGGEGRVQSGMVLLLSPFDDKKYMNIDRARQLVAIEKMHVTTRLFQFLGACSVALERLEIVDREVNESVSWDVDGGGITGALKAKASDIQKLKSSLQLCVKFSGSEIDEEKAKEFFAQSHLNSDASLQNILWMRLDENPPTEIRVEISLSESINSSIEFLASLNLPEIFTKLNLQSLLRSRASIEQIVKEKIDISSRIHVAF
jgi:hypothetical protein